MEGRWTLHVYAVSSDFMIIYPHTGVTMPNLILPVPVTYESVTRHVVKSVVGRVMALTGIADNTPIRFPGSNNLMYQNGTTLTQEEQNQFEHSTKLFITVQEEYREDAVIGSPVRQQDALPIFADHALNIHLKPIYSHTDLTINFTFRAASRALAERWRDDIKVRIADNRQSHLHELEYHYPVPPESLIILHHLHELRETQAAYGETLQQYLRSKFTKNATALTTLAGTEPLLVIKEKQVGVQGWFEFIEPPQADKDDGGASWTVNFSYKLVYQKPVSTNFQYPLVVHNQLISEKFYSCTPPYQLNRERLNPGYSRQAYNSLEDMYRKPRDPMGGFRVPDFDEWIPMAVPSYTATVATWLLQVLPEDTTLLLDLKDLGDHVLHPAFANFLRHEAPYLNKRGESIVCLSLFKEDEVMEDISLTVDENLVVRSTEPLDLRLCYHLRLSFITEFSLLTDRAREALQHYGKVALLIFQTLINELDVQTGWDKLIGKIDRTIVYDPADPRYDPRLDPNSPQFDQTYLDSYQENLSSGYMTDTYFDWFETQLRDRVLGANLSDLRGTNQDHRIEIPLVGIVTVIAERN